MSFFSPYKRHANKFNYTPRYYDPAREERERRRAELRGDRLDDNEEYTPGKYIRTRQAAREAVIAAAGFADASLGAGGGSMLDAAPVPRAARVRAVCACGYWVWA